MAKIGKQEYWCSVCDLYKVESDKPETGTFYSVFGHTHPSAGDDYVLVAFAVCRPCQKEGKGAVKVCEIEDWQDG